MIQTASPLRFSIRSIQSVQSGLLAIALAVFALGASLVVAQDELANVIEETEKSVIRIQTETAAGGGLGSGYLVSENGMFVTNVHVMAGASKAYAVLANSKKQYEITGTYLIDVKRDICVCQLKGVNMVPIKFAAALPRKGQSVTALGAPLGLAFSATNGIVSAVRNGEELGQEMGGNSMKGTWIQTDTPISPGNSGGPLINRKGEVVAMNTLASTGRGGGQNLNFGISIKDIKEAVAKAKSAKLTPLATGASKVAMHEVSGAGASDANGLIRKREIPDQAIKDYVIRGKEEYKTLAKNIRVETTAKTKKLKEMQKGKIGGAFGIGVIEGRSKNTYMFGSESIKKRAVKRLEERVTKLKSLKSKIAKGTDDQKLAAILLDAGPAIDVQEKGSVGFLDGAIVINAVNDHDVVVYYEEQPFLMWVESTTGLSARQELSPSVVYVAGTETVVVPGQGSLSVTVLQAVTERTLESKIEDTLLFKQWKSGSYSVEAKLITNNGSTVKLEKRDGTTIEVPLSKLDAESRANAKN